MTVLDIHITRQGARFELVLKGRVDAFGSRTLEEEIKAQMKLGRHELILNFQEVDFISSAGIRVFIKYFKELKTIGGALHVSELSEMVQTVFEMSGLSTMLTRAEAGLTVDQKAEGIKKETDSALYYLIENLPDNKMKLILSGEPGKVKQADYQEEDVTLENYPGNKYGIGLGALGNSFENTASRFGELLSVGEAVIYLPTDGSNSADYMEKSGALVPEAVTLSSVSFQGDFSKVVGFRAKEGERHVSLDALAKDLLQMSNSDAIGVVIVAETTGLVGCSLNVSPVKGQRSPFAFPAIREDMSFTTEPEHDGCIAVITGVVHKGVEELNAFSSPICGAELSAHFHAAAFTFHPLKKNSSDLDHTVKTLLAHDKLVDVLHLLNDTRPMGNGQSCFTKGTCWVGSIHSN